MQRPSFSIYDASAGSGKTYTLVKEYLKIILTATKNDAYRNILAITFTNKAVHEMKSRIVGNLSEFAKETPNQKTQDLMQVLSAETSLSIAQIKTKSQQIIKHIIHNYAAFDILTIDKFTHKVIRAFAHDLNLPMNFEVTLDTENLLIEAVDGIIAQAGEDEVLTKLLIDFTKEKTDDDKSWDISREILDVARLIKNENNRNEILHIQDKSIEDFIAIKMRLSESCKVLEKETVQFATDALVLIDKNGIDTKSFSGGYFPKHLLSIQLENFNPKNKTYHEFEDIKINKTAKDRALIENIIPELLSIVDKIYKIFEKINFYKAFLKNITPLSLLNTVSNQLTKIQNEQNVLSINEFNAIIYNEIQNQPAPFIYERLGERYQHFFIDEFQDTSEMQWQNLIPLINNATSSEVNGEKGTLMIVGDPKQSIYRWRGGKAEQFIELSKGNNPFNNPEKVLAHLDTNYRSYSQVINFNNDFFKFLSAEFQNLEYKDLYENHSHQNTTDKYGGYVNISFLPIIEKSEATDDEELIDKNDLQVLATFNTIQKVLKQGFKLKDIVVLTRKKRQGIAIANYLTAQKIPILSSETLMIQNATEVRFLINILKYLKNSADKESKAFFLEYLAQNAQAKLPVHDFIAEGMNAVDEVAFELWLKEIDVALSFKNLRKKSLYESIEILVSKFLKSDKTNAYVQYFLDIVLERDVRNQAGIADFLDFWTKNGEKFSIPSPEGRDALRIMTIHASKGLEFPVVIMPFAEEDYSRSPKNKLWLNSDEQEVGLQKVLIDHSSAVEKFGEDAKLIYDEKQQQELLDNINILYVALTRAEEQLYIISQDIKPRKDGDYPNNMASFFINFLIQNNVFDENKMEYEFGNATKISADKLHINTSKNIQLVSEVLNPRNIKIAQREAIMWGTNQQNAIEYGNIIHEILSFVKSKNDIDLAVEKSLESGLINLNQKEAVLKSINNIVFHPELAVFFEEGNQILNEKTIIQKEGGLIKPDRMVLSNNKKIYLLDYKTGVHHNKYALQLQNYQNAIEKMGYEVLKKSLIYIGEQINIVNL